MTKPISHEQREKLQMSIDFLKLDIWKKYTDEDDIETLVIGNVNHIELCIAKLTSSEQAWREEAERLQEIDERESLIAVNISKQNRELKEQLNQAVEVLKQSHIALIPTCIEKDNRLSCLCSTCIAILSIEQFLSSLSQETEESA